ncbi:MAG: PEPxxWA-CTERM sorting domain-containing protein [Caulobacteraceae bacterium]|nr:PEPxxWA-CTERM sorting domain-containing protein [Caulobacteraceae bacterium]
MKSIAFAAAAAAAVLAAQAVQANTVLSDNFNSDTQMLNWAGDATFSSLPGPGNQSPNIASTDLIGTGFYDLFPGNGNYVDLDGSTGYGNMPYAGVLQSNASFGAGTYTVSFDLGGNARGAAAQTTQVWLGSTLVASLTLDSSAPLTAYSYTASTTGGNLVFDELGPSDQQGNILDNVSMTTGVPEPAAWTMMLLGVGLIGGALRRSRLDPVAG